MRRTPFRLTSRPWEGRFRLQDQCLSRAGRALRCLLTVEEFLPKNVNCHVSRSTTSATDIDPNTRTTNVNTNAAATDIDPDTRT